MHRRSLVIWLLIFTTLPLAAGEKGGHLFIIGGGERPREMMWQFVELAGGTRSARIAIFPMASSTPDTTGKEIVEEFNVLGVKDAFALVLNRDQALTRKTVDRLEGVTGVWFSGGDQSRQMEVLLNTPVQERLLELYHQGAVMGGTSAGAAVMSAVMITGEERLNRDTVNAFKTIRKGNIVTAQGLGFLRTVVVDQHFVKRKRLNRLISVVLENPSLLGVGIDESTAIVVAPDSTFRVIGEGTVLVFDATRASPARVDKRGNLSAANILTHLLMAGDTYDMRSQIVTTRTTNK